MFWKDTFLDNFLNKEAHRVKLFHGTHLENLDSILSEGLINNVYLTPSIERATRYALGPNLSKNPIILELILTKPRRLKKLHWDPLDREEDVYIDSYNDYYAPYEEELQEIEDSINDYFANYLKISLPSRYQGLFTVTRNEGLHLLDGINIYKELLHYTAKAFNNDYRFKQNRNKFLGIIKDFFPIGDLNNYIKITPTGTFRLKPEYFEILKQLHYQKKYISPAAIKALWIRSKDFPEIQSNTISNFGAELLPDEKKDHLRLLQNNIENLKDDFFCEYSNFVANFKEAFESFKQENDFDAVEFIIYQNTEPIKQLIEELKSAYSFDSNDLKQIILNFINKWFDLNFIKNNINNPSFLDDFIKEIKKIESRLEEIESELTFEYDAFESKVVNIEQWKRVEVEDFKQIDYIFEKINSIERNKKRHYTRTWGD